MSPLRCLIVVVILAAAGVAGWRWFEHGPGESSSAAAFDGLAQEKQKEIWDLEHFTFEIENYVGKPFARALIERSTEELSACFREGFTASVPGDDRGVTSAQAGIRQTTVNGPPEPQAGLDAEAFCERLVARTRPIDRIHSARLRVLKIARDAGSDAKSAGDRWSLQLLLTAGGRDAGGNPVSWECHARAACRFSDGDEIVAGRIFERWEVEREILRTSEQPLLEEVTKPAGLDKLPIQDNWTVSPDYARQYIFQTAVDDYDLDGRLDIAVATVDGQCLLLRSTDMGFRDVTGAMGVLQEGVTPLRSYLATWFDFDNDGDPDLLLGSRLYRNVEGRRFDPVPDNGGLRINFNPMGSVVADYDCDGRLDLYVLYQRTADRERSGTPGWVGDDNSGAPNQLWRNAGEGRFEDVTEWAGASGGTRHTFAACWLHVNEDRYPDLYVANDFGENTLLINRGDGAFHDATDSAGVGDFATSMGVAAGDINDDGQPEIYVANMFSKMGRRILAQVSAADYPPGVYEQMLGSCAGNRLYQVAPGQTRYNELSDSLGINQVGWAYAPAFADFDADGDLDVYATAGFVSFDRQKPDG
jgi:FG-GAP-like repeat